MSKPIEQDDAEDTNDKDDDEQEHPAVKHWLDDDGDGSPRFEKFQRGRRKNRFNDD